MRGIRSIALLVILVFHQIGGEDKSKSSTVPTTVTPKKLPATTTTIKTTTTTTARPNKKRSRPPSSKKGGKGKPVVQPVQDGITEEDVAVNEEELAKLTNLRMKGFVLMMYGAYGSLTFLFLLYIALFFWLYSVLKKQ